MKKNKQGGSIGISILLGIIVLGIITGTLWYIKQSQQGTPSVQPTPQVATSETGVLRVGENIDEDGLQADTKEFQPFIDYLVSKLKDQGYTRGEFVGTKSVSEMAQLVREKKIDIVIDSAFPVYVVGKLAGAIPVADRWKGGAATYHTAIFVKQDSPIQTLDDLKGKILAFDSTTSTAGYFLPKAELIKQGYTMTQKNSLKDPVNPNEIGYFYVHGNVYESVANGTVPAGAESELEIDGYFGDKIKNYRIISKTPDILRFLVAVRGDLDSNTTSLIKDTLFSMDTTPEGRKVLDSFAQTAKFTPVTSTDSAYGVIKDLTNIVEEEIIRQ